MTIKLDTVFHRYVYINGNFHFITDVVLRKAKVINEYLSKLSSNIFLSSIPVFLPCRPYINVLSSEYMEYLPLKIKQAVTVIRHINTFNSHTQNALKILYKNCPNVYQFKSKLLLTELLGCKQRNTSHFLVFDSMNLSYAYHLLHVYPTVKIICMDVKHFQKTNV